MYNGKKLILAVNPGSTSIKIALYAEQECVCEKNLRLNMMEIVDNIEHYDVDWDSEPVMLIRTFLKELKIEPEQLDIVVARGGPAPPMKSGAYKVTKLYVDEFRLEPPMKHPAILAPMIAYTMGEKLGIPGIVYDSDSVDEADELMRITGHPEIKRRITSHNLNGKMMTLRLAGELGKPYPQCRFIVVHLGGGISVCAHEGGRVIDTMFVDEGPMTPTRSGGLPIGPLIDLCFSGKYTYKQIKQFTISQGGLMAYFGTNDALEIERRIKEGDDKAELVYHAMAYQTAKCVGQMAVALSGNVDRILITGGMSYSKMLVDWISERTGFIAPIVVYTGEDELRALAYGGMRVVRGEEPVYDFDIPPLGYESVEQFYSKFAVKE